MCVYACAMCVYFSPKTLETENELSLTQSPMKARNLNQYFCHISLQSLTCNYCKCHGNKHNGFHNDSCHCRNSITQNKNYLSIPHYVHLNPICSIHRQAAANTILLHTFSLLTPGLANHVLLQSLPLWSLNIDARCYNPGTQYILTRGFPLNSMYNGIQCGLTLVYVKVHCSN